MRLRLREVSILLAQQAFPAIIRAPFDIATRLVRGFAIPILGVQRGALSAVWFEGQVAQLVEQRIENPCVGGSIPPLATILLHSTRFIRNDLRR